MKTGAKPRPVLERLEPKVLFAESGCWEWQGATNGFGYGRIGVGGRAGGMEYTHRVAWESLVGPIPEGFTIDHLCRNRLCLNPDHLEPVTQGENIRRAVPRGEAHYNSAKTHCPKGHEYTPSNLIHRSDGRPTRECRECSRQRCLAYSRRKRKEGLTC
jgi:hypothetical protein